MTRKKAIVEFTRFLIHEHVIKQYLDNYLNVENSYKDKKYISTCFFTDFLVCSFHWTGSKEGYKFWKQMHYKWVKYLKNIKK